MSVEQRAQQMSTSEVAALLASYQSLEANHEQLKGEVAELKRQLDWLKKQLFGPTSERRVVEASPDQLSLGEGLQQTQTQPEPAAQQVAAHKRRRRSVAKDDEDAGAGLRFDDSVPVEVIELPDPATADLPADAVEVIGHKTTHKLAQQRGGYVVLEYRRPVVKRKGTGAISCAPAPAGVLEHSRADVSLLAGLIIDKLNYHLPLYRQHQRLADAGIEVSRGWLTQLVHKTASLLEPVYEAQLASIRDGPVIAMDETPIKATRKSRGKMKTTYYWPLYGSRDEVAFPWLASRSATNVPALLEDFTGTLLSDGYAAYARYVAQTADVVHAQCWSHTRRLFIDAESAEPELVAEALERIGALYSAERAIREAGLSGEDKLARRVERCRPIVEDFFAWCEARLQDQSLLPTNPFTKALGYALERRDALSVFLGDPDVPIDTNHLERALRPIPMGKKNWLFCWTELGAKYVGILQSLIATCRLHRIHPYDYLVDVLQRIDTHPASQVHLLTPRLWKEHFAAAPMRAPLDVVRQ